MLSFLITRIQSQWNDPLEKIPGFAVKDAQTLAKELQRKPYLALQIGEWILSQNHQFKSDKKFTDNVIISLGSQNPVETLRKASLSRLAQEWLRALYVPEKFTTLVLETRCEELEELSTFLSLHRSAIWESLSLEGYRDLLRKAFDIDDLTLFFSLYEALPTPLKLTCLSTWNTLLEGLKKKREDVLEITKKLCPNPSSFDLCWEADAEGMTPFHYAALFGDCSFLKKIIESCPSIEQKEQWRPNKNYLSPFHSVALTRDETTLEEFVNTFPKESKKLMLQPLQNEQRIIHLLSAQGRLQHIKVIIPIIEEENKNILWNRDRIKGNSPLHYAMEQCASKNITVELIRCLLKECPLTKKLDQFEKNSEGHTPFSLALQNKRNDLLTPLINAIDCHSEVVMNVLLAEAYLQTGHIQELTLLINLCNRSPKRNSYQRAFSIGHTDLAKYIQKQKKLARTTISIRSFSEPHTKLISRFIASKTSVKNSNSQSEE